MSNNLVKLTVFIGVLWATVFVPSLATTREAYYNDLFNSYGLEGQVVLSSTVSSYSKNLLEIQSDSPIFFVCDTSFNLPAYFSCSTEELNPLSENVSLLNFSDNVKLLKLSGNASTYIVIPEKNLYVNETREKTFEYLKVLTLRQTSEDNKSSTKDTLSTSHANLLSLIPYIILILTTFVFAKALTSHVNKLSSLRDVVNVLLEGARRILNFFITYRYLAIFSCVFLILMYLPLIAVLSLKDTNTFSFGYFIGYSLEALNPLNLQKYIETRNTVRLAVFIYNLAFLTLVFMAIFPVAIKNLLALLRLNISLPKASYLKYGVPLVLCFLISYTLNATTFETPFIFILFLVLITYLLITAYRSKKVMLPQYSFKERLIILAVLTAVVCFNLFFKQYGAESYKYQNLFPTTSKWVLLPYKVDFMDNARFYDFTYDGSAPLFADAIPLYMNNVTTLEAKNLKYFNKSEKYIILGSGSNETMHTLLQSEELLAALTVSDPSTLLYFNVMKVDRLKPVNVKISILCNIPLDPANITFQYFRINPADKSLNASKAFKMLDFPGCPKFPDTTEKDYIPSQEEYSYVVPVSSELFASDKVLLHIGGIDTKSISGIEVSQNSSALPMSKILDIMRPGIVLSNISDSPTSLTSRNSLQNINEPLSKVVVYSGDTKDSVTVYSAPNIAQTLNALIGRNILGSGFTLWSPFETPIEISDQGVSK